MSLLATAARRERPRATLWALSTRRIALPTESRALTVRPDWQYPAARRTLTAARRSRLFTTRTISSDSSDVVPIAAWASSILQPIPAGPVLAAHRVEGCVVVVTVACWVTVVVVTLSGARVVVLVGGAGAVDVGLEADWGDVVEVLPDSGWVDVVVLVDGAGMVEVLLASGWVEEVVTLVLVLVAGVELVVVGLPPLSALLVVVLDVVVVGGGMSKDAV